MTPALLLPGSGWSLVGFSESTGRYSLRNLKTYSAMDVTTTPKILKSAHLEIFKNQCDKENVRSDAPHRKHSPWFPTGNANIEKIQRRHNLSVSRT